MCATAAFGGVHLASGVVLASAATALSIAVGWERPASRLLQLVDVLLAVLVGLVLFQILPLPHVVVDALSPARGRFADANALTPATATFEPLTLSATATIHAVFTLAAIVLTYWTARSLFSRGGLRTFSLIVAWGGMALAILAFAQHAAGTSLVYGLWKPRDPGARPLGPFINRNHFGTWGVMAICVCLGYLQWRRKTKNQTSDSSWRSRLAGALDGRGIVLQLTVVLVSAAIALGASRSALLALACAVGCFAVYAASIRVGLRAQAPLVFVGVLAIGGMLAYGDMEGLILRLDETRQQGISTRAAIWRDTLPAIHDFVMTGVGAGAFATAMKVYQTTPRTYYHNEAHNQYLQIVAEGGMLLTVPSVIALAAFILAARDGLRRKDDPVHWMRVASACALFGVAVQSMWETGLTVPANGMFAAALAGILVHERAVTSGSGRSEIS